MSDEAFRGLRDIIYDNSGIYYQDQRKVVLENRLIRRIQDGGFENYENYLSLLRNDPLRNKEISSLFDIVTTNETSFFRD